MTNFSWFHGIVALIISILLIVLLIMIITAFYFNYPGKDDFHALRKRYIRGEIDKEEYEEMKRELRTKLSTN